MRYFLRLGHSFARLQVRLCHQSVYSSHSNPRRVGVDLGEKYVDFIHFSQLINGQHFLFIKDMHIKCQWIDYFDIFILTSLIVSYFYKRRVNIYIKFGYFLHDANVMLTINAIFGSYAVFLS